MLTYAEALLEVELDAMAEFENDWYSDDNDLPEEEVEELSWK